MSLWNAGNDRLQKSLTKSREYLTRFVSDDANVTSHDETSYPVYAAAGAVIALSGTFGDGQVGARDLWLSHLRRHQLNESLGWKREDACFGGWSFAHTPPVAADGQSPSPLATPNLSATVFALEALRAAGCPQDDAAIQDALVFVQRCQNFNSSGSMQDAKFDDGGFFFIHGDAIRNKAGEAGTDDSGRLRYRSYGSTTADGLRSAIYCGLPNGDAQVQAALSWLVAKNSAHEHPGNYPSDREHLRQSLYFYFCASAAEAIRLASGQTVPRPPAVQRLLIAIASRVIELQRQDGSWANTVVDVREDDPLVATPLAIRALSACHAAITRAR